MEWREESLSNDSYCVCVLCVSFIHTLFLSRERSGKFPFCFCFWNFDLGYCHTNILYYYPMLSTRFLQDYEGTKTWERGGGGGSAIGRLNCMIGKKLSQPTVVARELLL